MGAIARVTHRSGRKVWQARWRDPSGRQRAKNFDRKVDAERPSGSPISMLAGMQPRRSARPTSSWPPHSALPWSRGSSPAHHAEG